MLEWDCPARSSGLFRPLPVGDAGPVDVGYRSDPIGSAELSND